MKLITTLQELKQCDSILMGYGKKRRFNIKEQFEYYKSRTEEEKQEYKRFWEYCIEEQIIYVD